MNVTVHPTACRGNHEAPTMAYASPIDFAYGRESLAIHLASKIWASSGIPELEAKATTAAIRLSRSEYPDIAQRANQLLHR